MSTTAPTDASLSAAQPARAYPLRLVRDDESDASTPRPATSSEDRTLLALVATSIALKLALAIWVTRFVLVDDAYIHLRYARNLATTGAFVYNSGEAVFGLTSPAYGLFTTVLVALFGSFVEHAVIVTNILLWSFAAVLLHRVLPSALRFPIVCAFLFAPNLVDNQLLGMETPLFVLLLLGAMGAARAGRIRGSAAWYGLALIARPEAVLLAPCLFWLAAGTHGAGGALRALVKPLSLVLLIGPGVAWAGYAIVHYGSVVPQSMLAKSGWSNDHYEALFTAHSVLWTIPRLTLVPYIDYFAGAAGAALTAAVWAALGWVVLANVRRGDAWSRAWLAFYFLYVAFFVIGKGATEASWYAVPSTVAFLIAAGPAIPQRLERPFTRPRPAFAAACALALALPGAWVVLERAPLLQSYVDGYGAAADALNDHPRAETDEPLRVVIGEIGVYGFRSDHSIVDVGALVSPEVLPWKNAGLSFTGLVRAANADAFVISARALEHDEYPSVGHVWSDAAERAWFDDHCTEISRHSGKHTFLVEE